MSIMIDPYAAVPKYYQLASILKQQIDNGDWQPRTAILPTAVGSALQRQPHHQFARPSIT